LSDKYQACDDKLLEYLKKYDFRGLVNDRRESIGKKIRDAEIKKIPLMLKVGENEAKDNTVSLRVHKEGDKGSMDWETFLNFFNTLKEERK